MIRKINILLIIAFLVIESAGTGHALRPIDTANFTARIPVDLESIKENTYPVSIEQFEDDMKRISDFLKEHLIFKNKNINIIDYVKEIMEMFVPICYALGYPMEGSVIRDLCFHIIDPDICMTYDEAIRNRLNGVDIEDFAAIISGILAEKGIEVMFRYRAKTKYSIYNKFFKIGQNPLSASFLPSEYLRSIKDLFGMQLWVAPKGTTELDALLSIFSVLANLPKEWAITNYKAHFVDRSKGHTYPRLVVHFLVGSNEIPVEIQIRLANSRFAFEGIAYPKYKKYDDEALPRRSKDWKSIRRKLSELFRQLEESGQERAYHELLLGLYHGTIDIDNLIKDIEPHENDTSIQGTYKTGFFLNNGAIFLPIDIIYEIRKEEEGNRFKIIVLRDRDINTFEEYNVDTISFCSMDLSTPMQNLKYKDTFFQAMQIAA